jgi:hypothetical protein
MTAAAAAAARCLAATATDLQHAGKCMAELAVPSFESF